MSQSDKVANVQPTKDFFVHMITRDIELKDALLDLLDNCLDGARRGIHKDNNDDVEKPYEGYWAEISIEKNSFSIKDNCGGIGLDLAIDYAFRLGRADSDRDSDVQTVGPAHDQD